MVRLVALVLKLALQLHANLDRLEGMCSCYRSARGDAAGYESAVCNIISVNSIFIFFLFLVRTYPAVVDIMIC